MPARILVVEDNEANLELMVYLLESFGHVALCARDGEQGLALAKEEKPDLILCDVQLPKLSGYEVVSRLKADAACQAIPTVGVTALAMVGDRDRILAAGFDGYLSKPVDPEIFVQQVEAFLGQSSVRPPRADEYPETPRHAASRSQTILVVDDLPTNLELARAVLEPYGYRVLAVSSAKEGLEIATQFLPDLILSDVCMSEGNAFEFIRSVKSEARLARIPFVFITSMMLNEEHRLKALALGAKRYLTRPIEPQALLAEIESCLRESV